MEIWMKWQPEKVIAFIPFKSWPKNVGVKFQCKSLQTFFLRVDWKSQPIFVNLDLDICITTLKVEWQKWKIMVFPDDPFSLGPGKCSGANCEISLGYMTYPFISDFQIHVPNFQNHGWMKIHHVQPLLGWCFKNPTNKGHSSQPMVIESVLIWK